MIKKGKKRITITLDETTLKMCEQWIWMKPSWSYWVNQALQLMISVINSNNPVTRTLTGKELLEIKTEFIYKEKE